MSETHNLAWRVASALVLLPLVLALLWMGGAYFAGLAAVVAGLCGWEFGRMALGEPPGLVWLVALCAGFLPALFYLVPSEHSGPLMAVVFPGLAVVFFLYHLARPGADLDRVPASVGLCTLGVLYGGGLVVPISELRALPQVGFWWIVLLMATTWLNDTGAYFTGRLFGRRKLYERVSPGKTLEGAFGGLLFSVAAAFLVPWVSAALPVEGMRPLTLAPWESLLLGVGTGLLGPAGDLSESLLKRAFGVKDSSQLIPGHGGFLDRIDALLFNGVFVYAWAVLLR